MLIEGREFSLVPTEELTDLLNYKREYFKICELFKIPLQQRSWPNVGAAVIERVHTYITSYIAKRSLTERDNGAAFPPLEPVTIEDPNPKLQHTS